MKITVTPSIGEDVKDVIYSAHKIADASNNPVIIDGRAYAQQLNAIVWPNGNPVFTYSNYLKNSNSNEQKENGD